MDTFSEYTDNELWDALAPDELKAKVLKSNSQLDVQVEACNENLCQRTACYVLLVQCSKLQKFLSWMKQQQ
ncbi:hypothetical protein HK100_008926, partial [Physocladia obscura]